MKKRYPPFTLDAHNLPNTRHPVKRSDKYFDAKPARTGTVTKLLSKSSSTHYSDRPHPNGKRSLKKQVGVGEMMYIHDNVLGHYEPSKKRSSSSAIKKNIFDNKLFNFSNMFSTKTPKISSSDYLKTPKISSSDYLKTPKISSSDYLKTPNNGLGGMTTGRISPESFSKPFIPPKRVKEPVVPKKTGYVYNTKPDFGLPVTYEMLEAYNKKQLDAEAKFNEQLRLQEEYEREQQEFQREQQEFQRKQQEEYLRQMEEAKNNQYNSANDLSQYSIEEIYNYLYENGYIQ